MWRAGPNYQEGLRVMREVRVYGRMGDNLTNVNFRLDRILAFLCLFLAQRHT